MRHVLARQGGLPLLATVAIAAPLIACGSPPPAAGPLLQQASRQMVALHGFHFTLAVQGTNARMPVQAARGDANPPGLSASVDLLESGFLLEIGVVLSGDHVYVKSLAGGWRSLSKQEVAGFFDIAALFDRQTGLFAALRETQAPHTVRQETIDSHSTWVIAGRLDGSRVHGLLPAARDSGAYDATYWIEGSSGLLWQATLTGQLFDPAQKASLTFAFSKHDRPVTVTPPPLG